MFTTKLTKLFSLAILFAVFTTVSIDSKTSTMRLAQAQADVWTEQNQWNDHYEDAYSNWVENNLEENIFMKGKYQGVSSDCADMVYFARLIFAYENKLPFVIRDSKSESRFLTNRTTRFDSIRDELTRVKKFMDTVADAVSTKTIPRDTYPVKISRQWVRPGGVWSRPEFSRENTATAETGGGEDNQPGHASLLKWIDTRGVIWYVESTVPKAVRMLSTSSNLFFLPVRHETGLRYWKQPQHYAMSDSNIPGYSLEQFEWGGPPNHRALANWRWLVYEELRTGKKETENETLSRMIQDLCTMTKDRATAVQEALDFRASVGGRCMSASEYDNNSTPSRDKRALDLLRDIVKQGADTYGDLSEKNIKKIKYDLNKCGDIKIGKGQSITLNEWAKRAIKGALSTDPNDSVEARWGMAPLGQTGCPVY